MSSSAKRLSPAAAPEPIKKRRRGATRLSCAECRRLKLRCDRSIPCSSCVKRGCGAICPDGSLTTGQGNRFVLASTQELHEKITELCNRVRDLEDGLRVSHALTASDTHPLLSDELLHVKAPLQREMPQHSMTLSHHQEEEQSPDVVDSYGTLSINEAGYTKYFGQFANSWYFLQNEHTDDDAVDDRRADLREILPVEILECSGSFPIAPVNVPPIEILTDRLRSFHWYLPPADKAAELRDIYFSHAAWMYNPIPEHTFNETVFSILYNPQHMSQSLDEPVMVLSHRLALMFMVLAVGSLMDARLPAYSVEAEKYHQLARAALFQTSIFDEPSLSAVKALYLMTFYLFLADRHGSKGGSRWAIMGMAVKLAQSIGLPVMSAKWVCVNLIQPSLCLDGWNKLAQTSATERLGQNPLMPLVHYIIVSLSIFTTIIVDRDVGRWNVEPDEVQRRRELFWELYVYDSWQCLTFGRPPAFTIAQVDCKMPHSKDASPEQVFHAWKHRFTSECMSVVHDQAFGAKTPSYATVLQLDRKLRACVVPEILQIAGFGHSSEPRLGVYPESVPLILQRHIVLAIREMNLLYMHRSFFARALSDHPKDPLGSPYGTSVIAAYRSAGSLVALMRNLHSLLKDPMERMWFLWTHMFSCAIILGSIVTRCPSMSLAPSALVQLDSACELFSKAARGFKADTVLDIMIKLRGKAHVSLQAFRDGKSSAPRNTLQTGSQNLADEDDELFTLGGKTRLVARREPVISTLQSPSVNSSTPPFEPVVPLPLLQGPDQPVHQNVVDYLRTFGPFPGSLSDIRPDLPRADHDMFHTGVREGTLFDLSTVNHSSDQLSNLYPQQPMAETAQSTSSLASEFPQFFPVLDYSNSMMESSYSLGMTSESQNIEASHGLSSGENSMQGAWQEFVAQLGMH